MSLMSTPESSRKRTLNFSSKEVNILISLVAKYKERIECKKTDRSSNNTKNEAWLHLAREFNSMSGDAYRDAKILRNKYENIKKRSKQRFADEKMYRRGTGGGPEKPFIITEVDQKVKDIIGSQMTGLISEFDGDQENHPCIAPAANMEVDMPQWKEYIQAPPVLELDISCSDEEEASSEIQAESTNIVNEYSATSSYSKLGAPRQDVLTESSNILKSSCAIASTSKNLSNMEAAGSWAKYIPSQLRTPKSVPLKRKTATKNNKPENIGSAQSQLSHKVINWASSKVEIANEHLKFLHEEHELKLKQMRERHELDMKIATEESEERRHYFVLQAELQLEILRKQLEKK